MKCSVYEFGSEIYCGALNSVSNSCMWDECGYGADDYYTDGLGVNEYAINSKCSSVGARSRDEYSADANVDVSGTVGTECASGTDEGNDVIYGSGSRENSE